MSDKDHFANVSDKDLKKAQKQLDKWCADYGLETWDITSNSRKWKELVLRMAGIQMQPEKKRGRTPRSFEEVEYIGRTIEIFNGFDNLDSGTKSLKKESYHSIAEMEKIEAKQYESGRRKKPEEVVRGINNQYKSKKFQKKLTEKIERDRANWNE